MPPTIARMRRVRRPLRAGGDVGGAPTGAMGAPGGETAGAAGGTAGAGGGRGGAGAEGAGVGAGLSAAP